MRKREGKRLTREERAVFALKGLRWVTIGGVDVTHEHRTDTHYKCPYCGEWVEIESYLKHREDSH